MLIVLGGLPGSGKTTLARLVARDLQAVHLRVDTIELALEQAGARLTGPEGYAVAYKLAEDNLRLGLRVVADSVNPLEITRQAWRDIAARAGVSYKEIEIVCSDAHEHQQRVVARRAALAEGHEPAWDDVLGRDYQPWAADVVIDTFGCSSAASAKGLLAALALP